MIPSDDTTDAADQATGLPWPASWAGVYALVLGCLLLVAVPFGTLIGIYTIWVLTQPEATQLLAYGSPD